VVESLAQVPGAAWETGTVAPALLVGYMALLLSVGLAWEPLKGLLRRMAELAGGKALFLAMLTLGVLATLIWRVGLHAPDGRLHLYVLDTGGGEALLIQTPTARHVLINGARVPAFSPLS
jgi:hypothetical protein